MNLFQRLFGKKKKKDVKPTPKPSVFFTGKSHPRIYEDDYNDQSSGIITAMLIEDALSSPSQPQSDYQAPEVEPHHFNGFSGGDSGGSGSYDSWVPDTSSNDTSSSYDSCSANYDSGSSSDNSSSYDGGSSSDWNGSTSDF